jgi:acetyltransferase-like isoleucine patch superfamily enzyme
MKMSASEDQPLPGRIVKATYGLKKDQPDPPFELGLSEHLRGTNSPEALLDLYMRFTLGEGSLDVLMRRAIWRALVHRFGNSIQIGTGVVFKHPETFDIGDGVYIGSQTCIQGRFDGTCVIGNHVWIGPQSFLDARDLIIEDYVGWGPGAKVLGSTHTGVPLDIPVTQTDLEIKPVRIEAWADIGVNAVILPGIRVGKGSLIGAGAVVTRNVEPFSIVAGVPARFLGWRDKNKVMKEG